MVIASLLAGAAVGISGFFTQDSVSASALERGPRGGQNSSSFAQSAGTGGTALTPLSDAEIEGLLEAIEEEYNAMHTYLAVVEQYGEIAPFVQIARSEESHLNALLRQADKYGVVVPEMTPPPARELDRLEDACALGAAAEIADADLYDAIMAYTTHEDLLQVYTRLQRASLESHLPQFQTCD